ncbi:MAG: hypothetical protein ACRDYC_13010 [Acidimicrobiales bacterium]
MNGYVVAGYLAAVVILAVFAWRTARRGRVLARLVGRSEPSASPEA